MVEIGPNLQETITLIVMLIVMFLFLGTVIVVIFRSS